MIDLRPGAIVLASQSPARRAMLAAAGVAFEAVAPHVDEGAIRDAMVAKRSPARDIADALAETKARKVSVRHPGALVLGADQVLVTDDGALLEKPLTVDAGAAQLRQLAGKTHQLISAAVIVEHGTAVWRKVDVARLTMRPLSDAFIAAYLAAEGEPVLHCVGTYRIESLGSQLFTAIRGDHFTVQGLPLFALLAYLRQRGILAA